MGVPGLYRVSTWAGMALHTALTFTVLAVGLLASSRDFVATRLLTSDRAAGAVVRRLLPAAILLPPVLAWLVHGGRAAGLYGPEVERWFLVASLVTVLIGLVLTFAATLERVAEKRRGAEEALRAAEERYRNLAEKLPLVTYIDELNESSSSIYISPQVEDLLGYSQEEWLEDPEFFPTVLHPDDRDRVLVDDERESGEAGQWSMEYRLIARDGRTVWVRDDAVFMKNEDEQPYVQGFLMDVTKRKEAEEALRRQNEELAALHETALGLIHRLDVDGLLEAILAKASELVGTRHAYLYLSEGEDLVVRVGMGLFGENVGYRLRPGQGLAGQVFETGEPLQIDDYHGWSAARSDFEAFDFHAVVGVPLRTRSGVVGVLGLAHDEAGRLFTEGEIALLSRFGDLAALALENARLYAAAQEELEERRRAEHALRESEERFRTLISNVPGAIFRAVFDWEWRFDFMSAPIEIISGYPAEDFLRPGGRTLDSIVHPDDLPGVRRVFEEAARTGTTYELEYRIIHAEGSTRWVLERGQGIVRPDGSLLLDGALFDITARREAEEKLREAEHRTRTLVEQLPLVTYVRPLDVGASNLYVSPQVEELLGYSVEEWQADPGLVARIVHPEDRMRVLREATRVRETREPFRLEYRYVAKDGRVVWVLDEARVVADERGQPYGVQGFLLDITERRAAEEARGRLAAIVESSDDAIFSVARNGTITSWNAGAERMYGYSADEIVGKPASVLTAPDRPVEIDEILEKLRRGERVAQFETVRRRKDGTLIDVSVTASPVLNAAGEVVGAAGIQRDITQWKRAQAERERLLAAEQEARAAAEAAQRDLASQNERLRELDTLKDQFLALVSHELRTPLTSIRGYVELLLEDDLTGEHRRFLEVIDRNAHRLVRLVGDLLFLAQIEDGKLSLDVAALDVSAVAAESVETARPAAAAKGITLTLATAPLPAVPGDRARLGQVLDNLLSNAVKFTPEGGRVDVRTRLEEGTIVVEVRDSGIGIPAEEQAQLFDRFFRASTATRRAIPGTGLGLAISKAIVEAHAGDIEVVSVEGAGTTFRTRLPVSTARPAEAKELASV